MRKSVLLIIFLNFACAHTIRYERPPITFYAVKTVTKDPRDKGFYGLTHEGLREVFHPLDAKKMDGGQCIQAEDVPTAANWNENYLKNNCQCP